MIKNKNKKFVKDNLLYFEKKIFILTKNNFNSAILVILIHYLFIYIISYLLFFKKNYLFILSSLIWVIIFILNYLFNGCIIIRLERKLLNNYNWYGPWNIVIIILENIFKIKDKKKINSILKYIYLLITILFLFYLLIKIYYINKLY